MSLFPLSLDFATALGTQSSREQLRRQHSYFARELVERSFCLPARSADTRLAPCKAGSSVAFTTATIIVAEAIIAKDVAATEVGCCLEAVERR